MEAARRCVGSEFQTADAATWKLLATLSVRANDNDKRYISNTPLTIRQRARYLQLSHSTVLYARTNIKLLRYLKAAVERENFKSVGS